MSNKTKVVYIEGRRDCYSPEQLEHGTMTVGQLIEYLEWNFDKDAEIMLENDRGYTYGCIGEESFRTSYYTDEEDEEEYEDDEEEYEDDEE